MESSTATAGVAVSSSPSGVDSSPATNGGKLPTSPDAAASSSASPKHKRPKQWRWAENDFTNRDTDYEIKVHKDEALPLIEDWLRDNYERRPGVCTAKRGLYSDYLTFCRDNGVETSNNSAFGKVFKKVFPNVETRRLGKRSSNMTFYHDFARKGTMATGPSTEATNGSDAVTPLRRPKRNLKKNKQDQVKPAAKRPREDDQLSLHLMNSSSSGKHIDAQQSKRVPTFSSPTIPYTDRLRGGAAPVLSNDQRREDMASSFLPNGELKLQPEQSQRLATLMNYSDTYWREVWALAAVNPACLEKRTVTALFFTPPNVDPHVDPVIALNTYHALSVGAFLVGDLDAAEELFNHARYQLGGVFDTTDYDVANALCGVAFWHRFACTNRKQLDERTIYYLNQSLQICRNLKDTNNDIYLTAMREWGYFVGFSEDWLRVLDDAERDRAVDLYNPTYTRHWVIDSKYIYIHTNQKGQYNTVCKEVENFFRMLLQYEKERQKLGNSLQDGYFDSVKHERRAHFGAPQGAGISNDVLLMWQHELYTQKSVVDEFTRKILQGEMRFLPLATSIIIHMTLIIHVRYYAALELNNKGHLAAAMVVKLLISLPRAFKAVLMTRMEGDIKAFLKTVERRWLSCFTRLLGEFNGRYVQLAGLYDLCTLHLSQSRSESTSDEEFEEQDLTPTGREKEELLQYFLEEQGDTTLSRGSL